jgi:glycosyltransferase involved in cell wall biosynthesis
LITWALGALQLVCAAHLLYRWKPLAGKERIHRSDQSSPERVSIIVPVLNEVARLGSCLEGLIAQPAEVNEIIVVDGGSTDSTQALVASYSVRDARVELVDASPVPDNWTGKAWGLQVGLQHTNPLCQWILCVDADVRTSPKLVRSLLGMSGGRGIVLFSSRRFRSSLEF